ncbi:DUF3397 family protein [Levilactobacillus fujinensis]|uniref:DUF3397 family protein n=1 Tax=Levilactobacillus fujinensis TaxID=2486024 RepID=A0ABW1TCR3_9LACO|nr:DUF3397 family protein [Levilactobacillus fujinensis]
MAFWASPAGQLAILVIGWLVIRASKRVLKRHWPTGLSTWDLMAPLLILCSVILVPAGAGVILPWLVMGWMGVGILVTVIQAVHNQELLYSTFFKTFWRLTDLFWALGFIACFLLVIS